jgi:hypothetical protein
MVRNATKLYYPVKESISSILPIVDEFVVALGKGDPDDRTLEEILSLGSEKIKIIHTEWDTAKYSGGTEYAHQTDISKDACRGDWLFYLQSDEVVHEDYLPGIRQKCEELLANETVEGLLFDYLHFWGDYNHYIVSHAWYNREIRIIRNRKDIHSWGDAQSFRRIPDFEGFNYRQKPGSFKLRVARADATIYHYGWVRPPHLMQQKRKSFHADYAGRATAEEEFRSQESQFDYGDLSRLPVFTKSQPAVMKNWIKRFDWAHELDIRKRQSTPTKHKHDRLKYRILTSIEQNLLGGNQLFTFKNYILV